jgi:hypothetical protein
LITPTRLRKKVGKPYTCFRKKVRCLAFVRKSGLGETTTRSEQRTVRLIIDRAAGPKRYMCDRKNLSAFQISGTRKQVSGISKKGSLNVAPF